MFSLIDCLDISTGVRIGFVAGLLGAAVCLAGCWVIIQTGADKSASLAASLPPSLPPWWGNWDVALVGFLAAGLLFGVAMATRPEKRKV